MYIYIYTYFKLINFLITTHIYLYINVRVKVVVIIAKARTKKKSIDAQKFHKRMCLPLGVLLLNPRQTDISSSIGTKRLIEYCELYNISYYIYICVC